MPEKAKDVAEIEQQLRGRAHNTAIAALEVVPFAMLIADGSAGALAVNSKWMELSGLGRSESLGSGWLDALDADVRFRLREDVLRVAGSGAGDSVDYQLGSGPARRWTRWWISHHDLDGLPLVAVAAADIEEDYARQENLYHLATHDSLTGLVNRRHFLEAIEQALLRGQRQSRHVAVVYVDLDGFKRVNDRGGHSLGDRVLFAIAARLRHAVRAADMVARIGGDEFAVLCEGLSAAEQADVVARRIAMALTESVDLDGERWSVAASVGAAIDRGDPDNAEDLVDRADRAMYSIKLTRRTGDRTADRPTAPLPDRRSSEVPHRPGPPAQERRSGRPDPAYAAQPDPAHAAQADPAHAAQADPAYARPEAVYAGQPDPAYAAQADPAYARPEAVYAGQPDPGYSGRPADPPFRGDAGHPGHYRERPAQAEYYRGESYGRAPDAEPDYYGGRPTDVGVRDPDNAHRALRQLAEAAGAFGQPAETVTTRPEPDPARHRLAADVLHLRESIDSIRRMLDRLLDTEGGIIDIREEPGHYERR